MKCCGFGYMFELTGFDQQGLIWYVFRCKCVRLDTKPYSGKHTIETPVAVDKNIFGLLANTEKHNVFNTSLPVFEVWLL